MIFDDFTVGRARYDKAFAQFNDLTAGRANPAQVFAQQNTHIRHVRLFVYVFSRFS